MSEEGPIDEVLVIESDASLAANLARIISNPRTRCYTAANGEIAMQLLRNHCFFLVITEPQVPKVSGFKLLKYLFENCPQTLTAVISSDNTPDTRGVVIRSRTDFYLEKPLRPEAVLNLMQLAHGARARRS